MTSQSVPSQAPPRHPADHSSGRLDGVLGLLSLLVPAGLVAWRRSGRMRQALARSAQALHQAREQLDVLLNQAPVGIVQTDLGGRFLLTNERFRTLVGRRSDVLQAQQMLDVIHPEDHSRHQAGHARMLATGEPFVIEKRLVRSDETEVWVISHMSVTHDPEGHPLHVIAAVQDISHRRAAEAALHAMNATLEQRVAETVAERTRVEESLRHSQRMEALGQLAGGVAHDFNNVLQAIAGGARLIQRRPHDPETVRRLAGLVVDAADRGASVTRRLLSFARRDALQPGPVEAAPLLQDMQEILARTLGSSITVQASADAGLPPLLADRGQLETVLVNLATNARDALLGEDGLPRPGENRVALRASLADGAAAGLRPGAYILIEVTDNGPGMDGETLLHATEPFFTTKPRSRGTGLGLSVARGFAEQSGGALQLVSAPGGGTTARLWFPVAPAMVESAAGVALGSVPRIVLVDDDPEVREVIAETLSGRGCLVDGYASAASALERLRAGQADVLISDLSMPGTDGLTLIQEAQRLQPGLPAVLLTGHAGPGLATAVARVTGGRVLLLQKPVRGADLAAQLQALLPEGRSLTA